MSDLIESALATIRPLQFSDFIGPYRELPPTATAAVETLADAFARSDLEQRQGLMRRIENSFAFVFSRYGHVSAIESIRRNDPSLLRTGLISMAIENGGQDWRDSFPILALIHHSARKLGVDAAQLFNSVATLAFPPLRGMILSFCDPNQENRTIESYHYRESGEDHSFTYLHEEPKSRIPSRTEWKMRQFLRKAKRVFR